MKNTENEIIPDFMGWERYSGNSFKCPNSYPIENSTSRGWTTFTADQLQFHTSWDWIMPVWHKCREIGLWMSTGPYSRLWLERSEEIQLALLNDETPEKASILISNLIKWYNTTKL